MNKTVNQLEKEINTGLKGYYYPKDQKYFLALREKTITNLSKTEMDYLRQLEVKFKELVILRNKLAEANNQSNYFDFIAQWDAVPDKELKVFFINVNIVFRKMIDEIPKDIEESEWFDGNYYNFNLANSCIKIKYKLPFEVTETLAKQAIINPKYFNKIEIINSTESSSFTEYDYQKKKAKIYFRNESDSVLNAADLAHEYGHALGMLEGAEHNKETDYPKPYIDEQRAVRCEFDFINSLSNRDKKIVNLRHLQDFINTVFENEIYRNPDQDFGEVHIRVQNQLTGRKSKLRRDLSYLLDSFLLEYPCYYTNYSVNLISLLIPI